MNLGKPTVEAIRAALPEISKDVAEDIAARIAAGQTIDTADKIAFTASLFKKKQRWMEDLNASWTTLQSQNDLKKRAA